MRDLTQSCRHECECPSQLYHDVMTLAARIDAPIPPPSLVEIRATLRDILIDAKAEADAAIVARVHTPRAA